MTSVLALPEAGAAAETRMRRRQWLYNLRKAVRSPRGIVGLSLMSIVLLIAFIGPYVTPYSATSFQTLPFARPSGSFLLGGDVLGRDVLSRILDGGWEMLLMAAASAALGVILGAISGISAAYLRGRIDGLIMRTVDVILAFPPLVFALLLVSIVGPKVWLIIIAVGLSHAPQVARVLRSATLDISERDFVKAVELQGVSSTRVMAGEILPNLITPLMVEAGLRMTYSIIILAGLSYLGFGIPPPAPTWGGMISENQIGLVSNLWGVVGPAALIAMLTVGTSTFTDAIARVAIGVEARDLLLVPIPVLGDN